MNTAEFTHEDALQFCERKLIALGEPAFLAKQEAHLPVAWAEKFIIDNKWCTSLREACEIALSECGDPYRVRAKARRDRERLRERIDNRHGQLGVIPSRETLLRRIAAKKGYTREYADGSVSGDLVAWFRVRWNERNGFPETIYRAMSFERSALVAMGAVSRGVPSLDKPDPAWHKERTMIGLRFPGVCNLNGPSYEAWR